MTKDGLLAALNATGIPFAFDAWDTVDITHSYGVVDASSVPQSLWADNQCICQVWSINVFLYSIGGKDTEMATVQNVLNNSDCGWSLANREFVQDINAIRTQWVVQLVT